MKKCYVVFYNGDGEKADGFDCEDPMEGLAETGNRATWHGHFEYPKACCFIWEPDQLPALQWTIDIA